MKKKIVTLLLAGSMAVSLAACTPQAEGGAETTEGGTEESGDAAIGGTANVVNLGEYKGIEVEDTGVIEVTDDDIDMEIESRLSAETEVIEVTDRAVENGDMTNIDYEGKEDGVAFEGGTAEGAMLEIGSGQFIPGFEEGLIGVEVGETVDIELTFPEDYGSADLAGADVVFTVTVNSIQEYVVPELTEEFIETLTGTAMTEEEYRDSVRSDLEAQNESIRQDALLSTAWAEVTEAAEVVALDQVLVDELEAQVREQTETEAAMYGMEMADYVAMLGMTEEAFDEALLGAAEMEAKERTITDNIIEAEGLEFTEEEYTTFYEAVIVGTGFTSVEELFAQIPEEEMKAMATREFVKQWVLDNAVIK